MPRYHGDGKTVLILYLLIKLIPMAKNLNFKSLDSLKSVENVINDASAALKDKSRTIAKSAIPEALVGAVGLGAGGAVGFAALYYGGTVVGMSAAGITSGLAAAGALVGGGMAAGVAVLAAPAVVLGGAGYIIARNHKEKKLKQEKERLYNVALQKQQAIIDELKHTASDANERIEYLTGLNLLLRKAIKELKEDLGI